MGNDDKQLVQKVWRSVEQVTIPFYGHELVAVRLEDGRIAAVLRWLFDGMGLNVKSQMRHIQGRKALADGLIDIYIDTGAGGEQAMAALTLDILPGWLLTVDERRVKEEAYDDVVLFQRECVQALADYFARKFDQSHSVLPTTVVETTAITTTEPPTLTSDASLEERRVWRQLMREWLDRMDELDLWRSAADARQTALEGRVVVIEGQVGEIARIVPEMMEKLGAQTLAPQHQAAIQRAVNILNELIGVSHANVYNELRQTFKVGKYNQIPDARWPDVVAWFRPRLQAAERRAGSVRKDDPFDENAMEQRSLF